MLENISGNLKLNLNSSSKIPVSQWGPSDADESQVIIRDNHLLVGVLDKNQFGASAYGLVHAAFECFGPEAAGQLLTCMGKLYTHFLQYHGFSCGMDDLMIREDADKARQQELEKLEESCRIATMKVLELGQGEDLSKQEYMSAFSLKTKEEKFIKQLDREVKGVTSKYTTSIIKSCLPQGQLKPFPENCFSLMTVSGAKGSIVNFSQVSCLLGQQEIEGSRPKFGIGGRTLPSFEPFDNSPKAGGFVSGRFLTGLNPQEFFFHTAAGRMGLIDTAVKTARSGYLQRCLVKQLEGLRVHYDNTVRDSNGDVIQFLYGEDGIDPTKSSFLKKPEFFAMNYRSLAKRYNAVEIAKKLEISSYMDEKIANFLKKSGKKVKSNLDTVLNHFPPHNHLGATSESFREMVEDYAKTNPHGLIAQKRADATPIMIKNPLERNELEFRAIMNIKYLRSIAEPGESVGIIAAQSIGEPSTQMTLK